MSDFALAPEIEALRDAADRLGRRELAPNVRIAEADGRWPQAVLDVLNGFPLGGLDLPETLGGVDAGARAKVSVLEAVAVHDAAGLLAADQPGRAAGALLACPDRALAAQVAASCLAGEASSTLVVLGADDSRPGRVDWAPSWPPLRWVWVSEGDTLRLVEITGSPEPSLSLAFQASGGVVIPLDGQPVRGEWSLYRGGGLALRGRARLWAAAVAVGIAQAALEETIEYTVDRIVFGKPVAHHQGNAFDLAAVASRIHGARLVVRDAALSYDQGDEHAGFWASQAWLETMEAGHDATNVGIQLLGGHGFLVDHLAEKRFREIGHLTLLSGGRDAALDDVADVVLDIPDPLLSVLEGS